MTLHEYDVIAQMMNPIQFDGHSCGVYVCWQFIRQVLTGLHLEINDSSLKRRRFELFYYFLSGQLLPVVAESSADTTTNDNKEEKQPSPNASEDDNVDDVIPPTQPAQ